MLNVHCEWAGHLQSMAGGLEGTLAVLYIKVREKKMGAKLENLGDDEVKILDKEAKVMEDFDRS